MSRSPFALDHGPRDSVGAADHHDTTYEKRGIINSTSTGLIAQLRLYQPNARHAFVHKSYASSYEDFTATLGDVEEFEDETIVHISLRLGDGSSLDGYTFDPGPYRLRQESGDWGITEVAWPYFFYECGL